MTGRGSLDDRASLLRTLRTARGRYGAERASQLSGVPKSTIYNWQRNGVYLPDFRRAQPMAWSYRDLVYLRLLAWLRQRGIDRPVAAERVATYKSSIQAGENIFTVDTLGHTVLINDEHESRIAGDDVPLPWGEDLYALAHAFDILAPIAELGSRKLWGPDLVNPTPRTTITPSVMAGEPCVAGTRIPTAALYALHSERGLSSDRIRRLYPALASSDVVDEAIELEERLRRAA